jgi:hypothetical protein
MTKLLRFGSGTRSFTGERGPAFVALQNPHPMKFSAAGADAFVVGTLATRSEEIASLIVQLKRDIEEIEAAAKAHFG